MVRKEEFKEEDGAVMLEPEVDVKETFDKIIHSEVPRLNNTLDAPVRDKPVQPIDPSKLPPEFREVKSDFLSKKKVPPPKKNYDTDTDTEPEAVKSKAKKEKVMTLEQLTEVFKETAKLNASDPLNFEHSL